MSASLNWIAWKREIVRPKAVRSLAYDSAASRQACARPGRPRVGSRSRLGQPEGPELPAQQQIGQPGLLLGLGPEVVDQGHPQRDGRLQGDPYPGVGSGDLLDRQAVGQEVGAGSPP